MTPSCQRTSGGADAETDCESLVADGTLGWPEHGPYDAILVGAASPDVPAPLLEQLAVGGQLLVPVGGRDEQVLMRIRRTETGFERSTLDAMRFVPLIGTHGFEA